MASIRLGPDGVYYSRTENSVFLSTGRNDPGKSNSTSSSSRCRRSSYSCRRRRRRRSSSSSSALCHEKARDDFPKLKNSNPKSFSQRRLGDHEPQPRKALEPDFNKHSWHCATRSGPGLSKPDLPAHEGLSVHHNNSLYSDSTRKGISTYEKGRG